MLPESQRPSHLDIQRAPLDTGVRLRLSPSELRTREQLLPEPQLTEKLGGADLAVYRAKGLQNPLWEDPALRELVIDARMSYRAYGKDIPPLDSYDPKSAVYLFRASYAIPDDQGNAIPITEWSSLRFVPATGQPPRTEDLDFYACEESGGDKIPLLKAMRGRMPDFAGLSEEESLDRIVAQSRLCGIKPHIAIDEHQGLMVNGKKDGFGRSNAFTGIAFALMNRQFLADLESTGSQVSILTCQMHRELSDKILSYPTGTGASTMPFTEAFDILGYESPQFVSLDRESPAVYAYRYPGYFLDVKTLSYVIASLVKRELLSEDTVSRYLPPGLSLADVLRDPRIAHFNEFGSFLTTQGPIANSAFTGEELRTNLNSYVADGAILRIMRVPQWKAGVDAMIASAKKIDKRFAFSKLTEVIILI